MPTAEDFRRELFQMMANAQKNGREFIEISSRELHARVGPPLRRNYRMIHRRLNLGSGSSAPVSFTHIPTRPFLRS
jgi:hypothetical protein